MKTLDAHGDDYRNAQLTILLEVRNSQRKKVDSIFFKSCFDVKLNFF